MKTPFEILNIPEDADDRQVKKAYLEAVRRYPPEQKPQQFKRIRQAYEQIATMKDRLSYMLFDTTFPEPHEIAECLLEARGDNQRNIEEKFKDILKSSITVAAKRFDL